MIIKMTKIRVLGPKHMLHRVIATLQDLELVHLSEPRASPDTPVHVPDRAESRRHRHVQRALDRIESCLARFAELGAAMPERSSPHGSGVARVSLIAHRLGAELEATASTRDALDEERAALELYQPLIAEFAELLSGDRNDRRFSAYLLLVREGARDAIAALETRLAELAGDEHELRTRELTSGETALLLIVPASIATEVDRLLAGARVEAAPIPAAFASVDLIDALPHMDERLARVCDELRELRERVDARAKETAPSLLWAQRVLHDELLELDAKGKAIVTPRAFALEGWLPAGRIAHLQRALSETHGDVVQLETIGRDRWYGNQVPVVLSNPKLFEPFERLTSMLPLPRYGTIDPTPFVAVFFPMLFGIIVGDVGYGIAMLAIALLLARGAAPGGLRRDISRIAGAVACFTIIFGFLYGELLGDLGHRYLGMRAVWMGREDAIVPFLVVAIALGVGHVAIGLVLGALSHARTDRRAAIGRGITLLMLLLIVVALLGLLEWLPSSLFSTAIIALLVAFPALVVVEGFTGVLELFSVVGHVLSYARIMALGTASVMLAVVANRMAGTTGSAAVGVSLALLFHLVNFAIALFSPTIHVLRLHYVEFFGTFHSPGGARYQPFAHWKPAGATSS